MYDRVAVKTTLDIEDRLLMEAKATAARERKSLTKIIEEGIALRLRPQLANARKPKIDLPVFKGCTGLAPGIDPCSNKSMFAAADDDT